MRFRDDDHIRRGSIAVETGVGLSIILVLVLLTADTVFDYGRVRDECLWRQAAIWAASGQLQRIQSGASLESQPPAGILSDRISLKTVAEPGVGPWEGFRRVTVTATVSPAPRGQLHEKVCGYVRVEAKP